MDSKRCKTCQTEKSLEEFYSSLYRGKFAVTTNYSSECKKCQIDRSAKRVKEHSMESAAHAKRWREKNPEKHKEAVWSWQERNRVKLNEYRRKYEKSRKEKDPEFKLVLAIRSRFRSAFARGCKKGSAVKMLGCTMTELRAHLEAKFHPGMTWENYGEWHIDHIRPLASFDLGDPEQAKVACHYTNLQPLWAVENLQKGARIGL